MLRAERLGHEQLRLGFSRDSLHVALAGIRDTRDLSRGFS